MHVRCGAIRQKTDITSALYLKPFRENITEFRKRVEDIHRDDMERHGALRNELHRLMELNFFAMARMCRCALPAMRRQGRGKVINISSLGGLAGLPFQGAYSASKYAVEGYSEALRSEVRPFGVSVYLVEPGDFRTKFTASRQIVGEGSPYGPYCGRALERIERDETGGSRPEALAVLIQRLVEGNSGRFRHTAGGVGQRLLIRGRGLMGDRLFLRLLRWYYMGC